MESAVIKRVCTGCTHAPMHLLHPCPLLLQILLFHHQPLHAGLCATAGQSIAVHSLDRCQALLHACAYMPFSVPEKYLSQPRQACFELHSTCTFADEGA